MKKDEVSIIIINWNGLDHLKKCLPSIFNQDYKKIEVVLVDNSSTDGSVEYVRRIYPKIKVILNLRNLGFAEANNIGFKHSNGEYILFLNNDTLVTKNFLNELVKVLDIDKKIGAVQSKILLMENHSKLDSVGTYFLSSGFLYHYGFWKQDSEKYNRKINIYSAKGACMLFKREVLEKVAVENEIFDSRYFAYFEETDLCHRVWLAGFRIVFVPQSVIYHQGGGTSNKISSAVIQFHSFKNRINSYIKNLSLINLIKILPIHLFICEAASLIFLVRGKGDIFLSIQKALIWNIQNISSTLSKRSYIQKKIRLVEDRRLMPIITRKVRLSYYPLLFTGLEKYVDD